MTRTYSGRDVLDGLQTTKSDLQREQQAWRKVAQSVAGTTRALPGELDAAWQHLGEVVIPSLDPAALDEAAARLALPHVAARAAAAVRERDRLENATRAQAIEQDPAFIEREARVNAAQIRLAEVEDAVRPLHDSVEALRTETSFSELISNGYGTEAYTGRFWEASYYRHWKHADLVVEKHAQRLGASDFLGIRNKYLDERDALHSLEVAAEEQRAVLAGCARLAEEHAQARRALETLDARALGWARGRVREHVAALPPDELTRLLQHVPSWRVAGARVLGLSAKQAYLAEMTRQVLTPFEEEARAALADVSRQITKMSRPKKWGERMDQATYQKRIGRRRVEKWRKRRTDVEGASRSVQRFDRYDSYDPVRDFVWWNVMTGGAHDMPFAPGEGSAVLWGRHDDDDAHFAAAGAGARARDDRSGDRDFS